MRSTIKIASNMALDNILDNYARVLKIQNQMGKGKRVINPSDDPLATNDGMRLDTLLARIEQYNTNITTGNSFLALSDSALGDVNNILNIGKGLTIGAASETTTQEMRRTNAVEMNNLLKELVSIGNRQDGERFIFAGTETKRSPFEIVSSRYVHYTGNDKKIEIQADKANNVPINVTGKDSFGSLTSTLTTRDLSPDINMAVNMSTRLEDLNLGKGVPKGSINILYSAYPSNGLEVDLSGADTLEDVKDIIEKATLDGSQALDPLVIPSTDVMDRYIQVEINPDHNGIQLREIDNGTIGATPAGPTGLSFTIREVGGNTVARDLGIDLTSDPANNNILVGQDTDPKLADTTLLADLKGYDDAAFTIINGAPDGQVIIRELNDVNNLVDNWSLSGLTKGVNTGLDGQLYTRVTKTGAAQVRVDVYRVPLAQAQSTDLITTGTANILGGTVVMQQANNSGVSGNVSVNVPIGDPVGTQYDLDMETIFDPSFRAIINVPAFQETGDVNNIADGWHVRGLEKTIGTAVGSVDANDNFYVRVEQVGADARVRLYNDAARTTVIAEGFLRGGVTQGTIRLQGTTAFPEIDGTVQIELPVGWGGGPDDFSVKATFATVKDLMNTIQRSNTYTTAQISENGKNLEIVSHLAGAYLTVEEAGTSFEQMGDTAGLLKELDLQGIVRDINTDAYGNLYAEVVDSSGTGAGPYVVNVYKDRAHQDLVATGSATLAGIPGVIALNEANSSGLSGSVRLTAAATDSSIDIFPGGLRVAGDENYQLSQLDIPGIIPGTNADYAGNLYAEVVDTSGAGAGPYQVNLYKDSSHTLMVASGSIAGPTGLVTLNEVNNSGLGLPGSGTQVYLNYTADDNNIVLSPGSLRMNGRVREQNIFATMNDVIDAMLANDTDSLHNLIGNFGTDLNRVLMTRADVGARQDRLELINQRHEDEKLNFGKVRAERIDLDFAEAIVKFQGDQNVFEASLRTSAQIIPMSLVDFI